MIAKFLSLLHRQAAVDSLVGPDALLLCIPDDAGIRGFGGEVNIRGPAAAVGRRSRQIRISSISYRPFLKTYRRF